jgi:hypothetical protein
VGFSFEVGSNYLLRDSGLPRNPLWHVMFGIPLIIDLRCRLSCIIPRRL